MDTGKLILPFSELGASDGNIAGGKGASLGELTRAGIPVPPGFVVLRSAFDRFLVEAYLTAEIDAILNTVDYKEMHTVEDASEKIQNLIAGAAMPADITEVILEAFQNFQSKLVAVRSSATAEDGSVAAWAGQLNSYLNTTETTMMENIKNCWASLFTPRAIFYRSERGLGGQQISVAVVVQQMVASEVSGVAFSVHPVTRDANQMIIESGFGLGEAIVSGRITPDSFVVRKEPREIIERHVSVQNRALVRGPNGGSEWQELSAAEGGRQSLADDQALELAELVLKIEKHYGFPCDIEWAWARGSFYILQSRPITTLRAREPSG